MRLMISAFNFLTLAIATVSQLTTAEPSVTVVPVLKGEYSVPVPKDLEPYSHYDLPAITWTSDGTSKVELTYTLPQEITGVLTDTIVLTGEDNGKETFNLTGPLAQAKCSRGNSFVLKCDVVYQHLDLNLEGARAAIEKEFSDRNQIENRVRVAAHFGGEPHGIVCFPDMIAPPAPKADLP